MKQTRIAKRIGIALMALVLAFALALPVAAFAALQTNYTWYKGHESDSSYTIATAGELKALAKLVNGTADYDGDGKIDAAVDFAGKTITATGNMNFVNEAIEPIGTPNAPFKGTFDGAGHEVDNFKLIIGSANASTSASNVGVFGYVGEGGSVANLSVGPSSSISIVRDASSAEYIENVGMVVGFCAGSVTNCSNAGALSITSAVEQLSEQDYIPVRNVGGVVGQCVYDISGCSNSGTVKVAENATPNPDIGHGQLVARVGGVVGLAGDAARIGTYDNHIFGEADKHGSVSACTNTGLIDIDTPMEGALDRFGVKTNAESLAVGGVVGYSQGSISDCVNGLAKSSLLDGSTYTNVGYVRAGNGAMVGGICGSLRGVWADNTNVAWADDGANGADPLVVRDCTNYGDVYARVTAGGIVGKTSSYTTVSSCLNMYKTDYFGNPVDSYVVATRWNKPGPAGIVGTANGDVSFCANFATIASALWKDENSRTLNVQEGYYAAGIVGMLVYFDDRAPANGGISTPVPEVFSCYNAGDVISGSGMRQRGIVGENNGYVHENVLLEGVVDDDKIAYGDDPSDREASGTVGENRVYTTDELRSEKIGEAVAFLNGNAAANGWDEYWVISKDAERTGLNFGYPVLKRQDPWGQDAVSIAAAKLSLVENAPYTGGESTPTLKVTLDGAELTENADYRVIAQEGATEPSSGGAYSAYVVGLGKYAGESDARVAYDIVAGDFSKCTLTVVAHTFNYEVQVPSAEDVTVRTPAGTVVDSNEYTFAVLDDNDRAVEPVNAETYRVVATAKEGSELFSGTVEGQYRIKPASFMREVKFDNTTIEYLGETYPWVDSTEDGESDNPSTTLPYSGVAVKPIVKNVTYKGHELIEGTDYKIIYGNANSDEGNTGSEEANNIGRDGGRAVGCVTIRYVSGAKCNFSSYANMFFNIVDDGDKIDLSKATWKVEGEQISDGDPLEPVEIYLGAEELTEGVDYTIAYEDNVYPGEAAFTATGIGRFEGELTGSFEVVDGTLYQVLYAYAGTGADDDPYEATVTGAEYYGTRDTFSLEIPETVDHEGAAYTVVAIGEKAFGGSGATDFQGSVANESKLKLAEITLPKTVRSIGNYGFGTMANNVAPNLEQVTFAEGSELAEIGDYAFTACAKMKSLTMPAQVATIGRQTFYRCESLVSLRFLTRDSSLPTSVTTGGVAGAFRDCAGVTVYGYGDAAGVKALAAANISSKESGDNWQGGKDFAFVELVALDGVTVDAIADQDYTGAAIKPAVRVMNGGTRLVEGEDYELTYRDNVAAGTATAIVSGAGRWVGQIEVPFTIKTVKMTKVEFSAVADKLYDGGAASYVPTLTYMERRLVEGVDYTLSYADADGNALDEPPSQVGSYRIVATGMGSFTGSRYRAFRIVAASVEDVAIENIGQQDYTGAPIEPDPNVSVGGKYLVRDVDYVVTYANNVERGQAQVIVRGIGGYEGSKTTTFNIVGASVADAALGDVCDVSLGALAGDAVSFEPVVVCDGTLLEANVDYTVSYAEVATQDQDDSASSSDGALLMAATYGEGLRAQAQESGEGEPGDEIDAPSEVGTYFVVVKGKGNYRGSTAVKFSIVDGDVAGLADLSGASVELASRGLVYNGAAQKPAVTVTLDGVSLEAGKDYAVSYANNVGPTSDGALATATVHGLGAYTGTASAGTFSISTAQIALSDVLDVTGASYAGGNPVTPAVAVKVDGRSLVEGVDYTVTYANNVNAGENTAHALISGRGGYTTERVLDKRFTIAPAGIAGASTSIVSPVYSGSSVSCDPVMQVDGITLEKGRDYTLSYADSEDNALEKAPIDVGSYQIIAMGQGNYQGQVAIPFDIAPLSVADARVSVASQTYTGAALTPEVTVRLGSTILGEGDYAVSFTGNRDAGTAKVTVTGKGNYTGTATGVFAINPRDLSGASVSVASATYTGAALKPAATVKVGSVTLKAGTDYVLAYSNNTNAGSSAKVTVTGKGNYSGTRVSAFTIKPASQTLTLKAKTPKLKAKKLKKAKRAIAAKKAFTLSGAKTTVGYAKLKGSSKKLSINKKTGKITVRKGTKKGTYKLKLKVTAAASANYLSATKQVTVKVKVV